ncbi:MAG: hypothetical protein Q3987_00060 [Oscillospiraceae bacterium]|nr:hypothetical protein [Oscillospiraceae bacterium]
MVSSNRKMAMAGIAGTIVYAIADGFLYLGTDIVSDNKLSLWQVPEWRLMTSMWIGVIGSLLLLLGFISLARMFEKVFKKAGKFLILPAFLCIGGVLYMHFTLGVYAPLTYNSAVKAGVTAEQFSALLANAESYMNPLTGVLVVLGYSTEIVLIYGILSGKFGLKKRLLPIMFGGYFALVAVIVLIAKITGEFGLLGSTESLLEMTFFIPAFCYWKKEEQKCS